MSRVRRGDESGFSLVEVLISVVIMGICFAGLLGGMGMSILGSSIHRSQADGHALLVSAAEAVKDQTRNPYACPPTFTFASGVTAPSGWSISDVAVTKVEHGYWDGGGTFVVATDCTTVDLQRITLRVTSPDGRALETLTVIKRRP